MKDILLQRVHNAYTESMKAILAPKQIAYSTTYSGHYTYFYLTKDISAQEAFEIGFLLAVAIHNLKTQSNVVPENSDIG
jgi:hypothetical protein